MNGYTLTLAAFLLIGGSLGDRFGIIMLVLSGRSGQLAARIGPRLQLSAGPLVIGAGLALLTLAPSGPSYVR